MSVKEGDVVTVKGQTRTVTKLVVKETDDGQVEVGAVLDGRRGHPTLGRGGTKAKALAALAKRLGKE